MQPQEDRIHYLDNLRALAMLAGVLFHAALAYSPAMRFYWPAADMRENSDWVDAVVWFPHLFRMPLFFLTAGFFTAMIEHKRGLAGMLRNRVMRVLLPLAIFCPVLVAGMSALTRYAANTVRNPSPVLAYLKEIAAKPDGIPPYFTLSHLWFLAYLIWFYLLVWAGRTLELPSGGWVRRVAPCRLVLGAPLLLVPALASVSAPFPAPESVLPQLWALVFFGSFFGFGYWMFQHPAFLNDCGPSARGAGLASPAAYACFCWLLSLKSDATSVQVALAILEAYIGVWMTLWSLWTARAWLSSDRQWLRYLSAASYWVYLMHLPVLLAVQYWLLDLEAGVRWPVKFTIAVLSTFAITLLTYQWLVRRTFIGSLLNGPALRSKRQNR